MRRFNDISKIPKALKTSDQNNNPWGIRDMQLQWHPSLYKSILYGWIMSNSNSNLVLKPINQAMIHPPFTST